MSEIADLQNTPTGNIVIGKFKDETASVAIKECVWLKPKCIHSW